jgi:hypothetical protein
MSIQTRDSHDLNNAPLVLATVSRTIISRLRWRWRLNLGRLFMAMTPLAVVLGVIAWLDHSWMWN